MEQWEVLSSIYQGGNTDFGVIWKLQAFQEWDKIIKLEVMELQLHPSLNFLYFFLFFIKSCNKVTKEI